jgi:hypothetical protein
MIRTSPALLANLYDGQPKVIHLTPTRGEACSHHQALNGFRVLVAVPSAEQEWVWLGNPSEGEDFLKVPPATVWAIWAPDPGLSAIAHHLLGWWRSVGGENSVPALCLGDAADLMRLLLDLTVIEVASFSHRNTNLQRSLSALRDEFSRTARIPSEVMELIENLRLAPQRLIFAGGLLDERIALRTAAPGTGLMSEALVQRLPVWARGFLGVDLHVCDPGEGRGRLSVILHAADAGVDLAHWLVPLPIPQSGWLRLRLEKACNLACRALELRLSWMIETGAPPALSLAPVGALAEFAIKPEGRMLGLRLWGGLPGLEYQEAAPPALPLHPLPCGLVCTVPDHTVAEAQLVGNHRASYTVFDRLGRGRLLLHPVRNTVTAAHLVLGAEAGLVGVGCEVAVEDQRCRTPVACRMVVAPLDLSAAAAEREEGILASSSWTIIEHPLEAHTLFARLTGPWSGPVRLHLFSEYRAGGNGWYARTVFKKLHIELDRRSLGTNLEFTTPVLIP